MLFALSLLGLVLPKISVAISRGECYNVCLRGGGLLRPAPNFE